MKTCSKCNQDLPIECFGANRSTRDTLQYWCRSCCAKYRAKNGAANAEYAKRWRRDNPDKAAAIAQNWRDKNPNYYNLNKERISLTHRACRARHRDRYLARAAVSHAKANGTLQPQPCEACGSTREIHAHHEDYSKPLDVVWLCGKHHRARHREIKRS